MSQRCDQCQGPSDAPQVMQSQVLYLWQSVWQQRGSEWAQGGPQYWTPVWDVLKTDGKCHGIKESHLKETHREKIQVWWGNYLILF